MTTLITRSKSDERRDVAFEEMCKRIEQKLPDTNPTNDEIFKCVEWISSKKDELSLTDELILRHEVFPNYYSWNRPTREALEFITRCLKSTDQKVLSVGSGNGLWERMLSNNGIEIVAVEPADNYPVEYFPSRRVLFDESTASQFAEFKVVYLSWPSQHEEVAYDVLRLLKPTYMLFVGEIGGCTGTENFFNYVKQNYERKEIVVRTSLIGSRECIVLYKRIN